MTYGHAERNLALIRQLEAETSQLLAQLARLDTEQQAWLQYADGDSAGRPVRHQRADRDIRVDEHLES